MMDWVITLWPDRPPLLYKVNVCDKNVSLNVCAMNVTDVLHLHGVERQQQLQSTWVRATNASETWWNTASATHDCASTCLIWFLFLPTAIPDSPVRPVILGGKLDNEEIKNVIPEPVATPPPRLHQQPFDYDGEVYIGTQTDQRPEDEFPEEEEEEEEEEEDNGLNPRGDVFSKRRFFFFFFWLPRSISVAVVLGGPQCINHAQTKQTEYVTTAILLVCLHGIWIQLSISTVGSWTK